MFPKFAILITAVCLLGSSCQAELITFELTKNGNNNIGTSKTFTGLDNSSFSGLQVHGVMFDVELTVSSQSIMAQGSNGIEVVPSQYLTFGLNVVNVSGGTISEQGFGNVGFRNFRTDAAIFSTSNSIVDQFQNYTGQSQGEVVTLIQNPSVFSIIGQASGNNDFNVETVSFDFSGTSNVPEPTSAMLFGSVLVLGGIRRRRR